MLSFDVFSCVALPSVVRAHPCTTGKTKLHQLPSITQSKPMLSINLHERQQLEGPTPKAFGGISGTPKAKSNRARHINLSTQALKVAHQRVSLNVDLARRKVIGLTEITIIPTSNSLRVVRLDCREMKIRRVFINGSGLTNYLHNDLLYVNDPARFEHSVKANTVNVSDIFSPTFGINQHHLLRQKLNYIFGTISPDQISSDQVDNTNTEELAIILPENLKLELTDLNSLHTPSVDVPATGLTPFHMRSKSTHNDIYTPIQITVEYELCNPKSGLNFVCQSEDKNLWHAYTVNSEYNISTSSWVPCIDNLWERCTWSIDISIPRTVKDIEDPNEEERRTLEAQKETRNGKVGSIDDNGRNEEKESEDKNEDEHRNENEKIDSDNGYHNDNNDNNNEGGDDDDNDDDDDDDDDDDTENFDLFVCTGDFNNLKEMPHGSDPRKKVVSWSIFNPVCAHHVGWAVGPFQSKELSDFNEATAGVTEQDESLGEFEEIEKDESTLSMMLYFLPGYEDLVTNTCVFAHKALDFFLKEFGSYPFGSFCITFVSGPAYPYHNFAGLSIMSDKKLYPADVIEPMFSVTEEILECIASQWSTINIVPQVFNDIWCTIGIAKYMSFQFIKTLVGSNEFRYQIKTKMDQIVEQDVNKKPLGMQAYNFPISESDLSFVRLKAPVILFILDRRMTKTDKSFGLSRVLPKIFLQAMSGDLQNGTLSTQHFQYVCEKVNRNRLESFFKQWVYGIGTPIFNITQRFNKKRSMIEVTIRQTQLQQPKNVHPQAETFIEDSLTYLNDTPIYPVQQTFLGPMTIRVHEADGTPYEHIVDIKDSVVKFDVQYNTKFRRLKKNKDENSESTPIFAKLGDVLQSEQEMQDWNLADWPKRDEEFLDPFEWIRVDTDFEWIARFNVKQPDYMFGAQLQQDRDIEAQIAAIEYFGSQEKPNTIYCTLLLRTLMDSRYFYGVRIAAAKSLAIISKSNNNFAGLGYLIRAFKELYCFENSSVPFSNSFDDFGKLFLQKAIPRFLGLIKDDDGNTPQSIKSLLFNVLKYNDNSNNEFQDCYYVSDLIWSLTEALIPANSEQLNVDFHLEREKAEASYSKDAKFIQKVVEEFSRIQKLDGWVPSYQSVVSYACIEQKIRLARTNLIDISLEDLLFLTFKKYSPDIRALAFKGLFVLGGLKNAQILKYFMEVYLLEDSTMYFKSLLINALVLSISEAAVNGTPSMLDDPEFRSLEKIFESGGGISNQTTNMVVIEESTHTAEMDTRRDVLAKATIKGTIEILRRDYSIGKGLMKTMWELLHTSLISILDRRKVFLLCEILYEEIDSFPVIISVPCVPFEELKKKIVAKHLGDGKVVIKREGRFKIQLSAKILLNDNKKMNKKEPTRLPLARVSKTARSRVDPEEEKLEENSKLKLRLAPSVLSDTSVPASLLPEPSRKDIPSEVKNDPATTAPSESHLVKRTGEDDMTLTFKFKKRKLDLPEMTSSNVASLIVTIHNSQVKIRFLNPKKLSTPQTSNEMRYVKISTKTGSVSLSATPFAESPETRSSTTPRISMSPKKKMNGKITERSNGNNDRTIYKDAKSKNEARNSDGGNLLEPAEVVSTEKVRLSDDSEVEVKVKKENSDSAKSVSRSLSKVSSRSSLEETREFSRAASPFSGEQSSAPKRKKTKIYIHGHTSETPSPPQSRAATPVKTEESADLEKPKLKLKLTLN